MSGASEEFCVVEFVEEICGAVVSDLDEYDSGVVVAYGHIYVGISILSCMEYGHGILKGAVPLVVVHIVHGEDVVIGEIKCLSVVRGSYLNIYISYCVEICFAAFTSADDLDPIDIHAAIGEEACVIYDHVFAVVCCCDQGYGRTGKLVDAFECFVVEFFDLRGDGVRSASYGIVGLSVLRGCLCCGCCCCGLCSCLS